MHAVIIFLLILAVLLVLFTLQNTTEISIHIFFWEIANVPVILVILGCIIVGYIVASIYYYPLVWKLKREISRLKDSNSLHNEEEFDFEVKTKKPSVKEKEDIHPEGYLLDED
jgi:lipopolysaccharide assembly protein A